MDNVHVSWQRCIPPLKPEEMAATGRRGLWWSSLQLTSPREQSGSGRLQMWKGPGATSARLVPSQHTPRSGWKRWTGVVAAGLNTSLRWKRREMVARLRTYCVSIWEEMCGQLMTCVFVRLRAQTCVSLCGSAKKEWNESESLWWVIWIKKIALYLLYWGKAYVRMDDKMSPSCIMLVASQPLLLSQWYKAFPASYLYSLFARFCSLKNNYNEINRILRKWRWLCECMLGSTVLERILSQLPYSVVC